MKKSRTHYLFFSLIVLVLASCSEVDVILPDNNIAVSETKNDSVKLSFNLDSGELGFYIDLREVFKKGYAPEEAIITFPEYPQFDTIKPIDKWTAIASFSVSSDSITVPEKNAFNNGIDVTIVVNQNTDELVSYQEKLVLNNNFGSLVTIGLETGLEPVVNPQIDIIEAYPYLITVDGIDGLLRRGNNRQLDDEDYNWYKDNYIQQFTLNTEVENWSKFYFYNVEGDKYKIRYGEAILEELVNPNGGVFDEGWWGIHESSDGDDDGEYYITSTNYEESVTFEIVTDDEGWYTLRFLNPPAPNPLDALWKPFLGFNKQFTSLIIAHEGDENYNELRFKLLSEVVWKIEDLGVEYLPIIPGPVSLDFAFRSVLSNCSSGTLTEEVGRVVTKTRTTKFTITEGISLFSNSKSSEELSIEVGAAASVGYSSSNASVNVTAGAKISYEFTSGTTLNNEREFAEEETVSQEVSRKRTIGVPPFTVIDIYDAVKSVEEIYIPFVVKLKITGTYSLDGSVLSGNEIVHNLQNNKFNGVINEVNEREVLFSLRGKSEMNTLFESSSGAYEILNGCSN